MQCEVNSKSSCSNFGSFLVLIIAVLLLISVLSKAQDKKEPKHDKMKMEKTEKSNCSDEAGMSCCGGEKMKVSKVSEEAWNEVCPVLGNKIDKEVKTVTYDGKTYGFCCEGCDKKFEKNPEKYSKNLSDDGKKFVGKKS